MTCTSFYNYCNCWGAIAAAWCWYDMSAKDGSSVNYSLVNQIPAKDLVVCLSTCITVRGFQRGDSCCAARHTDTHLYSFLKSRVVRPDCTSVIRGLEL